MGELATPRRPLMAPQSRRGSLSLAKGLKRREAMKPKNVDISKGSIRRLARRGGDACTACLALPIEGWRWSCQ